MKHESPQLEFDFSRTLYEELVENTINILRSFEPAEGYMLAFSGGKDSVVLLDMAKRAGVKFDAHYHPTTVDPPELVMFVKLFPEVIIDKPKTNMWRLILKKLMPPTRLIRFCCEALKECFGENRVTLTGVRRQESNKRKNTKIVRTCDRLNKTIVNPLLYWTEDDIWRYIRENDLRYCCLYDEGFKRIGCVLCPMARKKQRLRDMERWPAIAKLYLITFEKLRNIRVAKGLRSDQTAEEWFRWWVEDETPPKTNNDNDFFGCYWDGETEEDA